MRRLLWIALLPGLLPTGLPGAPLAVVQVVREGLPPYEDADRHYRLEGDGVSGLRPGQVVVLVRPGLHLGVGRLEVLEAHPEYALARLSQPGATFPMKGDLAVPREPLSPLPALPAASPLPREQRGLQAAPAQPLLAVPATGAAHREPIYFLPEASGLTPGALAKLNTWVRTWGRTGRWLLALPAALPTSLDEARIAALREALTRLGVARIEEAEEVAGAVPATATAFPVVFVVFDPG